MFKYILVALTCYNAVPEQGWGDGTITADGTKITNPDKQRIIAVSHDLLKEKIVAYGDTVWLNDVPYVVRDKMNKRWKRKVDVLVPVGHPCFKKDSVIMTVKSKN